jgi:hypothetical protein
MGRNKFPAKKYLHIVPETPLVRDGLILYFSERTALD